MFKWFKTDMESTDVYAVGDTVRIGIVYSLMIGMGVSFVIPIVCVVWQVIH